MKIVVSKIVSNPNSKIEYRTSAMCFGMATVPYRLFTSPAYELFLYDARLGD